MGTTVILMPSFECYILNEYYQRYLKNNDRLAKAASLIDWEGFRSIIASSYRNLRISRRRAPIERVCICGAQEGLQGRARHGHDRSEGEGEDDVLLPLLQPDAGAHP